MESNIENLKIKNECLGNEFHLKPSDFRMMGTFSQQSLPSEVQTSYLHAFIEMFSSLVVQVKSSEPKQDNAISFATGKIIATKRHKKGERKKCCCKRCLSSTKARRQEGLIYVQTTQNFVANIKDPKDISCRIHYRQDPNYNCPVLVHGLTLETLNDACIIICSVCDKYLLDSIEMTVINIQRTPMLMENHNLEQSHFLCVVVHPQDQCKHILVDHLHLNGDLSVKFYCDAFNLAGGSVLICGKTNRGLGKMDSELKFDHFMITDNGGLLANQFITPEILKELGEKTKKLVTSKMKRSAEKKTSDTKQTEEDTKQTEFI